jgi:hypothetical protein
MSHAVLIEAPRGSGSKIHDLLTTAGWAVNVHNEVGTLDNLADAKLIVFTSPDGASGPEAAALTQIYEASTDLGLIIVDANALVFRYPRAPEAALDHIMDAPRGLRVLRDMFSSLLMDHLLRSAHRDAMDYGVIAAG